jgi:hypothetical protein
MEDLSIIPFLHQMLMLMKHKPEKDQLSITMNSRVFTEELLNLLNYLNSLNPHAFTIFQSVVHVIFFYEDVLILSPTSAM